MNNRSPEKDYAQWVQVNRKKTFEIKAQTPGETDYLLRFGLGKVLLGGLVTRGTAPDIALKIVFDRPDVMDEAFRQLPKGLK